MKTVEKLIEASLEELLKIDNEKQQLSSGSRIIFPVKRDGNVRVSEQEARFLFAKHLETQQVYHYSVETPTSETYRFKGQDTPVLLEDGRSASVDVCLHEINGNSYKRKHLVEFKAHNVDIISMLKDFLKLRYDNDGECMTNYFVHILETFDNGTIESLIEKYKTVFDFKNVAFETSKTVTNKVIVCLCFLKLNDTYVGKPQILFLNESNYQEKLTDLIKLRS